MKLYNKNLEIHIQGLLQVPFYSFRCSSITLEWRKPSRAKCSNTFQDLISTSVEMGLNIWTSLFWGWRKSFDLMILSSFIAAALLKMTEALEYENKRWWHRTVSMQVYFFFSSTDFSISIFINVESWSF